VTPLFPSATLPFDALLEAIGPDPDPMPADAEAELTAKRERRWARAREIYERVRAEEEHAFPVAAEFVSCFGVFHQPSLFSPLANCWKEGTCYAVGFASFLRALMEQGGHTSALLDEISVSDIVETISMLPKRTLMTSHELGELDGLPEVVDVFRGGWGASAEDVVERGVSWTLSEDVAEGFVVGNIASSSPGQRPFHLQASVKKSDVIAYFDGEYEVIIDPHSLPAWKTIRSPEVIKLQARARWFADAADSA